MEENLSLVKRTNEGRKPFSPKKLFLAKKKDITKGFDKSKILCYYFKKLGHFAWNFNTRKRREGIFHASTTVE